MYNSNNLIVDGYIYNYNTCNTVFEYIPCFLDIYNGNTVLGGLCAHIITSS